MKLRNLFRAGRGPALACASVAAAASIAGCGSSSSSSGAATGGTNAAGSDILRIPYLGDMSVPDPDIFYDIEGNNVILSTYEGLVTYAPGYVAHRAATSRRAGRSRRTGSPTPSSCVPASISTTGRR